MERSRESCKQSQPGFVYVRWLISSKSKIFLPATDGLQSAVHRLFCLEQNTEHKLDIEFSYCAKTAASWQRWPTSLRTCTTHRVETQGCVWSVSLRSSLRPRNVCFYIIISPQILPKKQDNHIGCQVEEEVSPLNPARPYMFTWNTFFFKCIKIHIR